MDKESERVKTSEFIVKPSESVYGMTSVPRGVCLIINNVNFEHVRLPTRRGSNIDARRLKRVFKELHFQVITKNDLTTKEMQQEIQALAMHELNKKCDAAVLVVLTHGDSGYICGTDHDPGNMNRKYLTYNDVVEELSNYNCKSLRNKPKMCFFQVCNGDKQSIAMEDNLSQMPSRKVEKLPEVSDVLLSFAAQEGYSTTRYSNVGGIYAFHLVHVLREFACKCDLQEMLGIVERRVRGSEVKVKRKVDEEETEEIVDLCLSTSVKLLGWSKKLYFNPVDHVY